MLPEIITTATTRRKWNTMTDENRAPVGGGETVFIPFFTVEAAAIASVEFTSCCVPGEAAKLIGS